MRKSSVTPLDFKNKEYLATSLCDFLVLRYSYTRAKARGFCFKSLIIDHLMRFVFGFTHALSELIVLKCQNLENRDWN